MRIRARLALSIARVGTRQRRGAIHRAQWGRGQGGGPSSPTGAGSSRQGLEISDRFQGRDERILRDAQFVEAVLTRADEQLSTRLRDRKQGVGLKDLVAVVARLLEIAPEDVVAADKQPLRGNIQPSISVYPAGLRAITTVSVNGENFRWRTGSMRSPAGSVGKAWRCKDEKTRRYRRLRDFPGAEKA